VAGALPLPASAQSGPIQPGISRELARHRAATLSDVVYDVSFTVPARRDEPVAGTVTLTFRKSDGEPLVLDFADPSRVESVRVDDTLADYRPETTHVVVPVAAGRHRVSLTFTALDGPLNRRDEFLYTLFVPDRAHEALPSFDQPDIKARFRLRLSVPDGWVAVANGEGVRQEEDGRVVYRFAETEPLPTYLFAFVAGRFQVVERERDGRRMRLFHRETDSTKVARNVETLFDLHATALRWLEDYTGIPYPFGKFDFVAIPSFQYGGMEHPGAILYRASSLFLDESATRNQELGRASVISHETSHMWFGDLVTMEWFDDVWMKEVFANFMAAKIVNPSFPELDHELRFLLAHYPSAYGVDRTPGANPIRQPLENLNEAGSLYGAIIYQKAPIVMRQLERLTGEAPFQRALRRYLDAHAFGNATWTDLVQALDREASLDVPAWSRAWIDSPGRPWLRLYREAESPETIRFVIRQEDPRGRGLRWDQVMDRGVLDRDSAAVHAVRLAGEEATTGIPAGTAAVVPNGSGLAYGLFYLDPETAETLMERLPSLKPAVTRAAAWLDLWELMLEGEVAPTSMFALGRRLVAIESDELIVQQVLGNLSSLFWHYLPADARRREGGPLEALLWDKMLEAPSSSLKAAFFNTWRSVATTGEAVERMRAIWAGELEIPGLTLSERDRTTLALHLAVREAEGWAEILDTQEAAIANPDRRARFRFIRPAVSADPAVRDSFFASLASPENRSREEWVVTALSYLHHPLRAAASIRYIRPSLDLLEEVRATGDIFFPTRWLSSTLSGHSSPAAAAIVRRFIAEHDGTYPPRLMAKLLQESDPLFRAVAIRAAHR